MKEDMKEDIKKVIESILFSVGDAISIERLAQVLQVSKAQVEDALTQMSNDYDFDRRGIMLARMGKKVQMCSRPEYAQYIRRATENRRPPSLSAAALEVLSIIAYRQPVTRAFIEQLRGVDSSNTVNMLQDKGLIAEAGRLDVPGRPMQFRTTDAFLRMFAISSLAELPKLPELADNEQLTLEESQEENIPAENTP